MSKHIAAPLIRYDDSRLEMRWHLVVDEWLNETLFEFV